MESDAGTSRLNPNDADDSSEVGADQTSTETTAEDLDHVAEAEDSSESEAGTETSVEDSAASA